MPTKNLWVLPKNLNITVFLLKYFFVLLKRDIALTENIETRKVS